MVDLTEGNSEVRSMRVEDNPSQEKEVFSGPVSMRHEMDKGKQENTDQWLEEEDTDTGISVGAVKQLDNEDDVSFSDLEDDDNDISLGLKRDTRAPSPDGSSEWINLKENHNTHGQRRPGASASRERDSEGEESNDWLTVDFDSDSLGAA